MGVAPFGIHRLQVRSLGDHLGEQPLFTEKSFTPSAAEVRVQAFDRRGNFHQPGALIGNLKEEAPDHEMKRYTGQRAGVLTHPPRTNSLSQAIFFWGTGLFCLPLNQSD